MLFCGLLAANCYAKESRTTYQLNTDWAFFRGDVPHGEATDFNDRHWIPVVIPHIMQLEKKHCGGNTIYDGIGWYRRYFKLPANAKDKRIALSFEGVMTNCEIFVNGQKVTNHHGGYVGFTVDITPYVLPENNVLAVKVSAEYDPFTPPGKPQQNLDFYYYSGIYRDVRLVVTDKLHFTDELEEDEVAGGGVFVTYPQVSTQKAVVHVKAQICNDHSYPVSATFYARLKVPKNRRTVSMEQTEIRLEPHAKTSVEIDLPVTNPQLWHPDHPNLYSLECTVTDGKKSTDCLSEDIGIRTIKYTAEKGLYINGEPLYLIGANRHQSFPYVGDAASNSMQERDVIDIRRGGYNAVRAAHYPHDPAFLSACDRYGLLVIECIPGWQYYHSSPVFSDRLEEVCRRMIRRDRNHPSIIMWETALNETSYPLSTVKRIYQTAHEEYPGTQFYTSGDYFGHEETLPYYDIFYKQVSRFPSDGNVMSNMPENLIAVKPLFTREWGDGVGEKPRVSITENEYEQSRQCQCRIRMLNGEGYFDWCMLDANPHMGGHFLWSYNDYARGSEEETMYSGVVDVDRRPKFCYYMMQSMRPSRKSLPGLYDGPMVHIASFNDSAAFPSSVHHIMVFSNCDEVRLYRNHHLIGKQTRAERTRLYPFTVEKGGSPIYDFDAGHYEPGTLYAEGWIDGKIAARHTVHTPERPHHLEIEIPQQSLRPVADGSDMIPVYIKVCDRNGTTVPSSDATIHIKVTGQGTLIGDSIPRIGVNPQKAEGGVGFVFVRTTKKAGKIQISATSPGLIPDRTECRSIPFKGKWLPDGEHASFTGHEEDGAVVKPSAKDNEMLSRPQWKGVKITGPEGAKGYPIEQAIDHDDFSWWIAADSTLPQVVTLELPQAGKVSGSRIRFQKDSSSYLHKVETSTDGQHWDLLYERECTGWDFKPVRVDRTLKYFRITFLQATGGHAGLAEVTLYQ